MSDTILEDIFNSKQIHTCILWKIFHKEFGCLITFDNFHEIGSSRKIRTARRNTVSSCVGYLYYFKHQDILEISPHHLSSYFQLLKLRSRLQPELSCLHLENSPEGHAWLSSFSVIIESAHALFIIVMVI